VPRAGFRITGRDYEIARLAGLHVPVEAHRLAAWVAPTGASERASGLVELYAREHASERDR
jgi:hypothetical protein